MSLNKFTDTEIKRWMNIGANEIVAETFYANELKCDNLTATGEIKCEDLIAETNITANAVDTQSLSVENIDMYPWKLQNGVLQNTQTLKFYQLVDLEGTTYIRLKGSDIGGESAGSGTPNFYVQIYLPTEYVDTWDFDTTKNFHLAGSGVWNNTVAYHFCIAWNLSANQDQNGKYCTITYNTIQGIAPENPYTWKVSYEILYPLKPAVP